MNLIHQLRWRPEIGDPSFLGWMTVFAYGVAALTCWLAARRAGRRPGLAKGSRGMWLLVSVGMSFLCVNKQLDLQSLVTDIGRVIFWEHGWYENRRQFQKLFIFALLGLSALTALIIAIRYHVFWRTHIVLGLGLCFLLTFVAVRAVSFHHVDELLKSLIIGMRLNAFLELSGIGLIWFAAMLDYHNPTRAPKPKWKPAQE